MRVLNSIEINVVAGGADQRNAEQNAADAAAADAIKACGWLNNSACTAGVKSINFTNQSRDYAVCIASGGQPGPESCGRDPGVKPSGPNGTGTSASIPGGDLFLVKRDFASL